MRYHRGHKGLPSLLKSALGSLLEMVFRMELRASMKDPQAQEPSWSFRKLNDMTSKHTSLTWGKIMFVKCLATPRIAATLAVN